MTDEEGTTADDLNPKKLKKQAELVTALNESRKSTVELEKAEIELAELKRAEEFALAHPDLLGRFSLTSQVSETSVNQLRARISAYAERHKDNPENAPIELAFCSPGGSVFDGLHLYATLRQLSNKGHHITTVVSGYAASMAGLLLQAGDNRVMDSQSQLHLHEPSHGAIGKAFEIKDEAEFLEKIKRQFCGIYAERSAQTGRPGVLSEDEIYEKVDRREWWMNAQEAYDVGFVDEIRPA